MATVTDYTLSTSAPVLIASGVGHFYLSITGGGGPIDVFIGDSAVSTGTGQQFRYSPPLASLTAFVLDSTDELWAVTNSGSSPTLRVLHTR